MRSACVTSPSKSRLGARGQGSRRNRRPRRVSRRASWWSWCRTTAPSRRATSLRAPSSTPLASTSAAARSSTCPQAAWSTPAARSPAPARPAVAASAPAPHLARAAGPRPERAARAVARAARSAHTDRRHRPRCLRPSTYACARACSVLGSVAAPTTTPPSAAAPATRCPSRRTPPSAQRMWPSRRSTTRAPPARHRHGRVGHSWHHRGGGRPGADGRLALGDVRRGRVVPGHREDHGRGDGQQR